MHGVITVADLGELYRAIGGGAIVPSLQDTSGNTKGCMDVLKNTIKVNLKTCMHVYQLYSYS